MFTFGRNEDRSSSQCSTDSGRSSTRNFYEFGSDSEHSSESSAKRKSSGKWRERGYSVNKQECDGLVKLLMIGESNVGKSSLVQRYVDDDFQYNWIATIGIDIRLKVVPVHGKNVKVQIWDSAGQERFRAITRRHFHGIHGVVIVFDVTDRETFDRLPFWIKMANDALDADIPRVIIGNKIDHEDKRSVSVEEATEFCRSEGINYVETSAMTSENVETAYFRLISEAFLKQREHDKNKSATNLIKVNNKKPSTRKRCC